jgi:hypothetical protein
MNDNLAAAVELKQEGNKEYNAKNYERAKQLYTQAIGTHSFPKSRIMS